jgi:hypothetical protein
MLVISNSIQAEDRRALQVKVVGEDSSRKGEQQSCSGRSEFESHYEDMKYCTAGESSGKERKKEETRADN